MSKHLFILILAATLPACTETRVKKVSIGGFAESRPDDTPKSTHTNFFQPKATAGKITKLDLRTAPQGKYYTLQVAHYEDPNNTTHRKNQAEAFAKELRAKEVEAYYYHGPNMSLVTVGSFKDAVMRVGSVTRRADGTRRLNIPTPSTRYSPEVEKMQQQFPHHLHNGRIMYYKQPDGRYMTYPPGHAKAGQRIAQGCRPVRIPGRKPPI